jgi:hypothetical protein
MGSSVSLKGLIEILEAADLDQNSVWGSGLGSYPRENSTD